MKGIGGGIENDASVENGNNPYHTALHLRVPKLKAASVLFLPISVKINESVHPTFQVHLRVIIEVRVNVQIATLNQFMEAAADEVRIGYQPIDPGEIF